MNLLVNSLNGIVDEISSRTASECFETDVPALPYPEQVVVLVFYLDMEVHCDSFEKWMSNPTGALVQETIGILRGIGAHAAADLAACAVKVLPEGLAHDYRERHEQLDQLSDSQLDTLDTLSEAYEMYREDTLRKALMLWKEHDGK
ncbi:MAG: DUF4375 domain-containing protein [Planctomycetaceae bacterium]|nr:DUF4375 domain-containing protein [Planctomycetaceae bacterium]